MSRGRKCKRLISSSRVVRRAITTLLMVDGTSVLGLVIDGSALVLLRQELLDFPIMLLDADGELEVFTSDGVPVLLYLVSKA